MCLYEKDDPRFFDEALGSISHQTVTPHEVILVCDGPIKFQHELILEKYTNIFASLNVIFNVIRLKENVGHGEARKQAVLASTGDLLFIADSDDINLSNRIKNQLEYMRLNSDCDVLGATILEIDANSKRPLYQRILPLNHADILNSLKFRCPMNQAVVCVKRKAIDASGGYRTFYHNEDYDLWIRMAVSGARFANLSETLLHVRVNPEFYKRRAGFRYFKSEYRIQRNLWKYKFINIFEFSFNVGVRFIVQVIFNDEMRRLFYKRILRKKVS